jgi:hypothetical protein
MSTDTIFRRQAIRAAVKIHEHLVARARQVQQVNVPTGGWEDVCQIIHRLHNAESKTWHQAAQLVARDADYVVRRFQGELEALRHALVARSSPISVLSAGEIAGELLALGSEFENVELDMAEQSLSVLTDGIELEGTHLGPFRIVLSWLHIGQSPHPYNVYAQEPCHPPDRQDTHPHVLDHQLCEGEGSASIKAALRAGRLFDFFVLVRQILSTYNPSSAYVALAVWNGGISCHGCDSWVNEDDHVCCDRCDHSFCSQCCWICNGCSASTCSCCSSVCSHCDERFCERCLTTPEGTTFTLCEACLAAQEEDETDDTNDNVQVLLAASPAPPLETPAAAPNSLCVGEVDLSPRPG